MEPDPPNAGRSTDDVHGPAALAFDSADDFADDDQVPASRPPGFDHLDPGAEQSAAFPDHFPIDDLVGSEEQVSFDTPPGMSQPPPAFTTDAQPVTDHAPRPQTPDLPMDADADAGAPADDVLAQIGRLSPKAAEAIAAALGDGDGG